MSKSNKKQLSRRDAIWCVKFQSLSTAHALDLINPRSSLRADSSWILFFVFLFINAFPSALLVSY